MAHKPDTSPRNPLKEQGESKRTVKETSDHAVTGPARNAAPGAADSQRRAAEPEQSDKGATSRAAAAGEAASRRQNEAAEQSSAAGASNTHPGQHGGIQAGDQHADTRQDRGSGVKKGPSPADDKSSSRTGTASHRGNASRRSGQTGEDRHRPRST